MAEVSLEHVSKTFDGVQRVVDDVTLHVPNGRLLVLVGPSGCGKSTTLRMIAGLERASSGDIHIGGRRVNDLHPKDRDVAMVFQNYALYPHMTVAKNMGFALRNRRVPKDEITRRVAEAAGALGIADLLARRPGQLSGGQQQRVALGRAIVRDPALFLFDEPLSNLDARLRVRMRAEIRSLQRRLGTTGIYVTHDQEEAMTVGDEIAIMTDGRVQQIGPPLTVYGAPHNRFVASFVGLPSMNFLEGRVEARDGRSVFVENNDGAHPIAIPPPLAAAAADGAGSGSPLVLGIRPQALSITTPDTNQRSVLEVSVEVIEPLGDVIDIVCRTSGQTTVVARIAARDDLQPGQRLSLGAEPAKLHLFEAGPLGRRLDTSSTSRLAP